MTGIVVTMPLVFLPMTAEIDGGALQQFHHAMIFLTLKTQ